MISFKQLELYGLYKMYSKGSGWDDGAAGLFFQHRDRYFDTLLEMLNTAEPGTFKEDVAFLFSDMALKYNEPIKEKIVEIAKTHPEEQTRCFWQDVLNGRFQMVPISGVGDGKAQAHQVVDTGSHCKSKSH